MHVLNYTRQRLLLSTASSFLNVPPQRHTHDALFATYPFLLKMANIRFPFLNQLNRTLIQLIEILR